MLSTIVSMYWDAPVVTKLNGSMGQPFRRTRGVRQGDPLSSLLFTDRIKKGFLDRCAACGVTLYGANKVVRMLLYADDLVLVAESPSKLQQLLDQLQTFCQATDMQVNVDKTEVVVFGKTKYTGGCCVAVCRPAGSCL